MRLYHGRARNLARVLESTAPIRVRPWGRLAWLAVAIIIVAALVARFH